VPGLTARRPPRQRDVAPRRLSPWRSLSGPQLLVASFAALVLVGTLGLMYLPGLYTGEPLGWLDALFTATTAACVTGLIVVDTATYFTPAGQAWLLLLIQLGGLGIITLTTLIIVALGRRLSLRQETLAASTYDIAPHVDYRRLARDILLFTFAIELVGAGLLYVAWLPRFGVAGAAWPALFHSISAFCNAGISTFTTSLMDFQQSPFTLLVIMALIVLGGIGFLTLEEIALHTRSRRGGRPFRLSLHSRIVLGMTALLIMGGWALFALFEWSATLTDLPTGAKLSNSLFMSVTARTAGYNVVDYGAMSARSDFLTILLMMIGGSPGSTAGGLKTTTIALIGLLAWSRLRGHDTASIWGRTVPGETVQRAVGVFAVAFGIVTLAVFAYATSELPATGMVADAGFLAYMFEAVSAFNTVGLSMGVTPQLTEFGRLLTIVLMFIGRVGPMTLAAAIALRSRTPGTEFRYAYEDVAIG